MANVTAADDVEKRESTQTGVKKIKDEGTWNPHPCAGGPEVECDMYMIMDGVKHLKSVPGEPGAGPGPRECGRVSCSWDVSIHLVYRIGVRILTQTKSAIFWCNEIEEEVTLGSYAWIANGAAYVCSQCSHWTGTEKAVSGEAFNSNFWSVLVIYDDC